VVNPNNVGAAFWVSFTSAIFQIAYPILMSAGLALTLRSYQKLVKYASSDTPIENENRTPIISVLSCALVLVVYLMCDYWITIARSAVELLITTLILGVGLIAVILGLIGAAAQLSPQVRANLLLSFFIIGLLSLIANFGMFTLALVVVAEQTQIIGVVVGFFTYVYILVCGSTMVLAWMSRSALINNIQYYALNEGSHLSHHGH